MYPIFNMPQINIPNQNSTNKTQPRTRNQFQNTEKKPKQQRRTLNNTNTINFSLKPTNNKGIRGLLHKFNTLPGEKKRILFITTGFIAFLLLVFLFILIALTGNKIAKNSDSSNNTVQKGENGNPLPTPKPAMIASPYNGTLMTEDKFNTLESNPPVAVMIQNNVVSRPQYALNNADIVYEIMAESGITRFMAIFWSDPPQGRIQSIRSARKYFVDVLREYGDPLYAHIGFSDGDSSISALQALSNNGIRTLMSGGVYIWDNECQFHRSSEHCAYAMYDDLLNYGKSTFAESANDDITKIPTWQFTYPDELFANYTIKKPGGEEITKFVPQTEGKAVTDFTVIPSTFGDTNYFVSWKFDNSTKRYMRHNYDGTPYLICTSPTSNPYECPTDQVYADTIILQEVNQWATFDEKSHWIMENISSGSGYIMQEGKAYEVNWSKADALSKTIFTDKSGGTFPIRAGRIWIIYVPTGGGYTDNAPVTPTETITTTNPG